MKKKSLISLFLVIGVIFFIGTIFSEKVFSSISKSLVYKDKLVKSGAIVVLAGSAAGNRVKAAAKLYLEGYADKLVFSGFEVYPETYSNILMKKYALKLGVPESNIITANTIQEVSTRGESFANLELLNKNHIKDFILVTSAYHTRRSRLIYEELTHHNKVKMKFLVYAAYDPVIPIDGWWKLRTGQKGIFLECLKSIAYYLNL